MYFIYNHQSINYQSIYNQYLHNSSKSVCSVLVAEDDRQAGDDEEGHREVEAGGGGRGGGVVDIVDIVVWLSLHSLHISAVEELNRAEVIY